MTLTEKLLLACVFVQVLLTFGILVRLGQERVPRVMRGEVRGADIALSREAWPDKARQAANAFDNQFQLPVLFYVAVLLTLWSHTANWLLVVLAIAFVVLRVVHAVIHMTSNRLGPRFTAYTASLAVLFVYWFVMALAMFITPGGV